MCTMFMTRCPSSFLTAVARPLQQGSSDGARAREHFPQRRALLDAPLEPVFCVQKRKDAGAAQRGGRHIIKEGLRLVAPVALVRLVADRKIKNLQPPFDGIAQQFMQMRCAGPKAGELAIVVARLKMIVTVTEYQTHIDRGRTLTTIEMRKVHQRAQLSVGRQRSIEVEVTRPLEQIGRSRAREGTRLLRDQ